MKEKIKKILFTVAEIGTVIWAIQGMHKISKLQYPYLNGLGINTFLVGELFYFLSATLILYLLKRLKK